MAENKLTDLKNKIVKSNNLLYSDIYYDDNSTPKEIKDLRNRVNGAIEKISNNNIVNTGTSNISTLYQKTYNTGNKPSNYDLLTQINQTLSDSNSMNNVLAVYTQNTLVRDIDREIDMVCKYLPKLDDALDTRREAVLSSDKFSKDSLIIKSTNKDSKNKDEKMNNIESLKKKYDIEGLLDRVYRSTDKYGEDFVYVIPYRKAIDTLLKRQNDVINNNIDAMPNLSNESSSIDSFVESAVENVISNETETIDDIRSIVHEAVVDDNKQYEDLSKKNKKKYDQIQAENKLIEESCNIKIEINKSRIIKSAILERMKTQRIIKENGSLFFNEKADVDISNSIDSNASKFSKSANEKNPMVSNGVTLLNNQTYTTDYKPGQIKVPGCIVKVLDHEMVKPLYIDDICLGYFYIECDKKMSLEQTTYSSTVGGIRPGGAYKGNYDYYKNSSNEFTVIKSIAKAISNKINAKFVNSNQDLSKEIYSILKYNSSVDASGKVSKVSITFIPPEDMVHSYFELDPETKRGVSGLLRSLFPAKLFSCLYISNTIQSITRGTDKRVVYVRQTVDTNISKTLLNVINQIQQSNCNIRQIESMSNVLNMLGRFNDVIIPRSASGDAPVDFEVLPGQTTEIKNDLMNMLEEMAVNATGVPFEELQARQQTDYATRLTMRHSSYLQKVYNRQGKVEKIFSQIVSKIYNYEFNLDNNEISDISVVLPPPVYLNAVNAAQIINSIADLSQSVSMAMVDEADTALTGAVKRNFQMGMITSLFPQNFLEKVMDAAKIDVSTKSSSEDQM